MAAATSLSPSPANPLVDADWVAASLSDDSVRLIEVDVAATDYNQGHIPGALLWNIYADLRHADYTPIGSAELDELFSRSGIDRETTVVFYGYGAHLGYWLLKARGHGPVPCSTAPATSGPRAGGPGARSRTSPPRRPPSRSTATPGCRPRERTSSR